jgi:hypothetical protein
MKHLLFYLIMGLLLFAACNTEDKVVLGIFNPLESEREDGTLVFTRRTLSNWSEIPAGKLPVLVMEDGTYVPSQVDDVDGDGQWDELFALADISSTGQMNLRLQWVEENTYPEFDVRTNLRLGDASLPGYPELQRAERLENVSYDNYSGVTSAAFQMEGPAWENDKVGFRNYMDQRNGMDIFGKTTSRMVLDSVGVSGGPSYHDQADWGMDVLKVGTSLGAGALAYMYEDSLYRLGDNGKGTYRVIFEGSQRSRFALEYTNWSMGDMQVDVRQDIEITGGRHYYQGSASYSGAEENLRLAAGIVNMNSKEMHLFDAGENHVALLTHDYQAEDSTLLGMAIMVPKEYHKGNGESPESGDGITQTYYLLMDAFPGDPVPYRFYSFWEREDPRWKSMDEIKAYLEVEAERWTQSIVFEVLQ